MQTENKWFDDISKVTTGALGVIAGMREELETTLRARFDKWVAQMDLVRRDEFDAVKEMAVKARKENEELKKRLDALEKTAKKPASRTRKTATRKTAAKKTPAKSTAKKTTSAKTSKSS